MNLSEKQKGILALVGLAFFYASMGIFTRFLNTDFSIFQQLYLRLFAGVIIGTVLFRRKLNFSKLKKITVSEWGVLSLRSITYYLLGVTIFSKAILLTKLSTVSFISSIPMTAIIGFIVLREKVTFKKILYLSLAFIGVAIISTKDFSSIFVWRLGEVLALISVVLTSFSIVIRKWQTKLLNNIEMTQILLVLSTIFIFIASLIYGEGLPLSGWNAINIVVIAFGGLTNVILFILTNYGFEKIQTSIASNILTLEMFFAFLFGLVLYREVPTYKETIGAILILFSVIQMNKLE